MAGSFGSAAQGPWRVRNLVTRAPAIRPNHIGRKTAKDRKELRTAMAQFFVWLEQLQFSTWVRESGSVWAYPIILTLHTIGMGIVVGVCWAVDLRLVGVGSRMPVAPMEKFFPLMWVGFAINATTGFVLLAADATTKVASTIFYIKMAFIFLAIYTVYLTKKRVFRNPNVDREPLQLPVKLMAGASLALWFAAIVSGRLMAYLGPVSGVSGSFVAK